MSVRHLIPERGDWVTDISLAEHNRIFVTGVRNRGSVFNDNKDATPRYLGDTYIIDGYLWVDGEYKKCQRAGLVTVSDIKIIRDEDELALLTFMRMSVPEAKLTALDEENPYLR